MAQEYGGRLYAVAYRLLRNRADAEDAVQRALMKAFAARDSYSPQWAISTWLYRVLSNVCIDELRRRPHREAVRAAGRPGAGAPASEATGDERAPHRRSRVASRRRAGDPSAGVDGIDLARALEGVPREARLLMALHYVDGLSYGELAKIRGISVNTVKSQLARGKSILRKTLEEAG